MTDTFEFYKLMTWASPAFPIGSFSYSHGIEYAVDAGLVSDAASLRQWIGSIIIDGDGRNDAIIFCQAYEAMISEDSVNLQKIMELASAMRASSEFALESRQQGEAFLKVLRSVWPSPSFENFLRLEETEKLKITFPVAFAVACAVNKISLEPSLTAYMQGFASNLVSAGVRLIPLGQTDGQIVVADLEADVKSAVDSAMTSSLDDLGSATPIIDWTSTQHESQYTRLFRS